MVRQCSASSRNARGAMEKMALRPIWKAGFERVGLLLRLSGLSDNGMLDLFQNRFNVFSRRRSMRL